MSSVDSTQDILEGILNDVYQRHGVNLAPAPKRLSFPDGFRWRYFGKLKLARGVKAYCYSTTKNANGKYLSWVYQPRIAKECWEYTKLREHTKRKDAKARAYRLSQ